LVIITPNNDKYRNVNQKNAMWIVNEPLIMREEGSGTRKEAEKQLKQIGIAASKLNVIASMENPEAIKRAVASGMGVSVMSRLAAESELEKGTLLAFPISSDDIRRDIYMIYNRNLQLSRSSDRLVKVVKDMYKKKDRSAKVE
jgi:DNA-binding transcriptional LysR family regulator